MYMNEYLFRAWRILGFENRGGLLLLRDTLYLLLYFAHRNGVERALWALLESCWGRCEVCAFFNLA